MKHSDHPGFELDEDNRQQAREWVIQRIAWVLFVLFLIAIALGLFGRSGPLSDTRASSPDGKLHLQYQRFMRNHSSDTVHLSIQPATDKTRISFSSSYIRQLQFSSITPAPQASIAEGDLLTFLFNTRAGEPSEIHFHFEPELIGAVRGTVAMDGGTPVHFSQFVYP